MNRGHKGVGVSVKCPECGEVINFCSECACESNDPPRVHK